MGPIGVFDSGYGGLTILKALRERMGGYDYLYLGDNARAPYGNRSYEVVYEFTRQAVRRLFEMGCPMVILACNTASAKALRTIQQCDLAQWGDPTRRVLGVIRPTVEIIPKLTRNGHVGLFGTEGTVRSHSYDIELEKMNPDIRLTSEICSMWVPLIENGEVDGAGADYFVKKNIDAMLGRDPEIDVAILGCTHYPLLRKKVSAYLPEGIALVAQGEIVAASLEDYFGRHPEMEVRLGRTGQCTYLTTEEPEKFAETAEPFIGQHIRAERIFL